MEKIYIGAVMAKACEEEREGVPGYCILYRNNKSFWFPRDLFEPAFIEAYGDDEESARQTVDRLNYWLYMQYVHPSNVSKKNFQQTLLRLVGELSEDVRKKILVALLEPSRAERKTNISEPGMVADPGENPEKRQASV